MKSYKLGDICTLSKGKTITRATASEGAVPVIGGGLGPTYFHNVANRKPPVITISASGANAGYVNCWDVPIWASDCTTIVEKPGSPVSIDYIYKYLISKQDFIKNELRRGSAQPHVYPSDIADLEILVPSQEKQREIVDKLDSAFAEIDSLEENLQQSDERASELLDSTLAALLTKPEIGSETNALVKQDFDIKIVKLSEVCSFSRGLTYGKVDEVEFSSNIVLRANNIDLASNSLNLADLRYIKDSISIKDEKIAKKDSIIICTASGSKTHMGKVALIDKDYGYAYGGFMGQLTPLNNCLPKYLYFILISRLFKDYLMALNDGTNINNLKFADIEDYELPLPSLERQFQIVSKLDLTFAEVETIRNQIAIKQDLAKMLRQSFLREAFSPTDVTVTA
jgi:type I restriction enzyme S subunit